MREARRAFDRARFRRWRLPTIATLVTAVAILVKIGIGVISTPPPPKDHRSLAVLPFSVVGAPADPLGREVAEVAYINLYWFPNLNRADFDRAAIWQRDHPGEEPAEAARALDVTRAITGTIERRGDSLRLQLIIPDSGPNPALTPIRLSVANGDARDLGRQAAIAIGMRLGARPGREPRNLASSSPEAIGQFVTGEALFDADAWHLAAKSYSGAVAFDSSFALARWRLLVARLWARESSWDEARELVACCADQLPPLEAGLVRAMSDTDLPRRFRAFDSLTAVFGASGSLPLLFASDLFHRGALVGRGLQASLGMFEQAIDSSPGGTPAPAYDHLVWGKTRLGERQEARRWLKARKALGPGAPGEPAIVALLELGTDLRWSPWMAKLRLWALERFGSDQDFADLAKFFRFSAAWDMPEGQSAVGRVIASRLLAKDRASGLEAQALAQFTWGRVAVGLAFVDSAAAYFRSDEAELQRRQWRLLLPVLGAGRASEAEEASARLWLRAEAVGPRFAARARWTLALDAMQHGDPAGAAGIIQGLTELGATDTAAARLAVLASAILRGQHDPTGALAQSAALLHSDSPSPGSDIFTRSLLHLSRARWFEALDRRADAGREILWYENSDTYRFPVMEAQKMEVDAVASVAARLRRARLLLATGVPAEACLMLSRVHELWHNADASLDSSRALADSLHRAGCR